MQLSPRLLPSGLCECKPVSLAAVVGRRIRAALVEIENQ